MADTMSTESLKRSRHRTRCGSWRTFERRFRPQDAPGGSQLWHRDQLPPGISVTKVWTIMECDGRLYVGPGFHYVNRMGYVVCEIPWTADDEQQPDYRYD